MAEPWEHDDGHVEVAPGIRVRGRALARACAPADFALVLAPGPRPLWPYREVRWPDFGVPRDRRDALDALREALGRAHAGERVEVACRGGVGRTGTALAALAVLEGSEPADAIRLVRGTLGPRAIETPWQAAWVRRITRER